MKLKGFLFSVAVGAVAGLLLAPKKGKETREDIKKASQKAIDKIKSLTKEDIEEVINEYYTIIKEKIDELADPNTPTQQKLNDLKVSIDELAKKAMENTNIDVQSIIDRMNKVAEEAAKKVEEYKQEILDSGEVPEDIQDKVDGVIEKEKEEVEKILNELEEASEDTTEE